MVLILDRTKIAIFIAGTTTVGALLLMAGLLVGVGIRLPDHANLAGNLTRQSMQAVIMPSAGPESSVPCNGGSTSTAAAERRLGGPKALHPLSATTILAAEVSPAAFAIGTTARAIDHILADEIARTAIEQPVQPEILSPPSPPATQAGSFAVQVGAFLLEREAESLVDDLQIKGYNPQITQFWAARHNKKRLWYAVRIGAYADRRQAAHAAADYTRKESSLAIVRPMDVL
jgi:cell division protein FtsN